MNKPKVTPKDFFLWAGAMIALYGSVIALITLLFEYIDHVYPDPFAYWVDPYSGGIRFAMASLIVLAPLTIVLMRFIRNDIVRTAEKADIWVRKWALVLTVFVAGATVIGDLIALVNTFLGGDFTTRFMLKVLVVLLVSGGVFLHFLADLRGYWVANPSRAKMVGIGAGIVVLVSVISGFFIMGTPGEVRLLRYDGQKVSDLQSIQWQITNYWQQKEELPVNLEDLKDPISGAVIPVDPQTGADYTYRVTSAPYTFELCAEFNTESTDLPQVNGRPISTPYGGPESEDWQHGVGETCFERTIDPERYPAYEKAVPVIR